MYTEVEQNKAENKNNHAWLRPVLIFYAKTTSWIIFPLFVAIFGGKYVGESTGSQTLFFLCVIVGFLITCLGIYREIKIYKNNLNEPK